MSAASEGFRFANQETGIRAQLEGGIRGLLIDTHPGVATPKGVYTVLRPDAKSQEKLEAAIGSAATAVAKGIRAGLGYRGGGKSELYLCHGYCEIGASRAIDQFAAIRDFLDAHRDAVLLVSVEDDATPREFSDAVAESRLLALVWKGPVAPLPTLGEMVGADQRVLFMVENDPGDVPWLHRQFAIAQETRFDFKRVDELLGPDGCAVNRGGTAPPLLLINMFTASFPPSRASASTLNARETVVTHANTCARQRHRVPNLIAVDNWQIGDVVGAARELNTELTR